MSNQEKIKFMADWVQQLKEEDAGKNCKQIEVLKYAIKQCIKAENRKADNRR